MPLFTHRGLVIALFWLGVAQYPMDNGIDRGWQDPVALHTAEGPQRNAATRLDQCRNCKVW